MTCFLSGGAKSGKSSLAQQVAVALSGGGNLYYVATLRSTGREDEARIRHHLADRAGLGFETVECFTNLSACLPLATGGATFLVDSVTSLLQNAMFSPENNYEPDFSAVERCGASLLDFARRACHVVFVSDAICADGACYDPSTEDYRRCLAGIDRRLAAQCETVAEVVAGCPIIYKGGLPL